MSRPPVHGSSQPAARTAERVTFSVGAIPERVAWAVELAHKERKDVSLGAQIIIAPHPDLDLARAMAVNVCAPLARFSTITGHTVGPTEPAELEIFEKLRAHYDMNHHGRAPQGVLTPEFVDRFAVVGSPDHCVERLAELVDLGLTRFVVCGPFGSTEPREEERSRKLLTSEVLPALRAAVS